MNRRAWNSTLPQRSKPLEARTPQGRGTGLTQRSTLSRSTGLRPVGARRAAENRARSAAAAVLRQEQPLCEVWQLRLTIGLPPLPGCARWADDWHEALSRARGGSITDPQNRRLPCRPCHDHLTITPESELGWARQLGLITGRKWGGEAA